MVEDCELETLSCPGKLCKSPRLQIKKNRHVGMCAKPKAMEATSCADGLEPHSVRAGAEIGQSCEKDVLKRSI